MEEDYEKFPDISGVIPFVLIVGGCLFTALCITGAEDNFIWLGDEVTTTARYTELFNDSFSGRVVTKDDGMYTVRDETGTEREFDRHWLAKCGDI